MAFLSVAELFKDPSGLWEFLILNVFDFITNYGWRILLFTVLLKLLLSPLDLYQRIKMRKNQRITERMAPALEKLKQQYGTNKQVLAQKQMELNKKEGFSYFSSCLPMLVTLAIFFYLFSGLNNISQYKNLKQYVELYDAYNIAQVEYKEGENFEFSGVKLTFAQFIDKEPADKNTTEYNDWLNSKATYESAITVRAKEAVVVHYEETSKESFLWIKNIWSADVPWTKPILDATAFERAISNYKNYSKAVDKFKIDTEKLSESDFNAMIGSYSTVTDYLAKSEGNKTNGLLILPILSVGLSFLSQFITSKLQKQSGQASPTGGMAGGMKMMMFIMPVMMGFFALQYTSAFTLYIVVNSTMTILINLITTGAMNMTGKKKVTNPDVVVRYGRPDPNDNNDKKGGHKKDTTVKQIGSNDNGSKDSAKKSGDEKPEEKYQEPKRLKKR